MISVALHRVYRISYSFKSVVRISPPSRRISFILNWLKVLFNAVDLERKKLVGADLVCAEWLLRNGGNLRFMGQDKLIEDYNELILMEESPNSSSYRIEEIYCKDASISTEGFEHLKGCKNINKVTFIFCTYLNNDSMNKLSYITNSLHYLEIRSCFSIGDDGILSLAQLRNLKTLILADLISVKKKDECESALKLALPYCKIEFLK